MIRPPRLPRLFLAPAPVRRPHVIFRERLADEAPTQERESTDRGRARGGLLVMGGGTHYFGLVPKEGIMPGARLALALPLPTLPGATSGSSWLSRGTVGVTGGFDGGTSEGVDAQIWRAGLVVAMGGPWTRDFIGVALEGGVLGGHYFDGSEVGVDPKPYGLARLTLQIPLRNDIRPFVAGDFGVTDGLRHRLAGMAGIHAGIAWNAW